MKKITEFVSLNPQAHPQHGEILVLNVKPFPHGETAFFMKDSVAGVRLTKRTARKLAFALLEASAEPDETDDSLQTFCP